MTQINGGPPALAEQQRRHQHPGDQLVVQVSELEAGNPAAPQQVPEHDQHTPAMIRV
jgi:hypothetical protein